MEVDESLHRITAWCNRHAPATAAAIRPPASADVLSTVQATTGRRWPDDLVAFYGSCDGTERTPAGYPFPGYCPDPLSDVGRHWTRWQTSWAGVVIALEDDETDQEERRVRRALGAGPVTEIYDLDRLMAEPAGATASRFLPAFVPFAEDQSGDDLFVDTRSGPQHGCVTEYLKGDADSHGPLWPSVTAMLAAVAHALDTDGRVGYWRPIVESGQLHWDVP